MDGTSSSIEKDLELYQKLVGSDPKHASPTEHIARVMTKEEVEMNYIVENGKKTIGVSRNFHGGFMQYRQILGI